MAIGNLRLSVLIVGVALYVGSLFAPAIAFEPNARSNPKRYECEFATRDGVLCTAFPFGSARGALICGFGRVAGQTYVDRAKILDYCQGWDVPAAHRALRGYQVLLTGIVSIDFGMFAWFANLLIPVGLLLSAFRKHRAAVIVLVCSVALGLQSFALSDAPYDVPELMSGNRNVVDHLGLGFYLWMGSLVAFTAYCFLKTRKSGLGAFSVPAEGSPRAP